MSAFFDELDRRCDEKRMERLGQWVGDVPRNYQGCDSTAPRLEPLECMYCDAEGPLYPLDADHPGWMCDACYAKAQQDYVKEPR